MNTGEENTNSIDSGRDKNQDQNIEWDNGEPTYGHAVNPSSIKRKDAPSEDHLKNIEEADATNIISDLKNVNLTNDSDLGGRNSDEEKGIGGKSL
ncbi:hypothetical protein DHW03_13480 [Pedobacter yonginense]|uniref:Uncharacterized protein n=1 Tax=Pedobacter yonginense TaxID=651869 RepID=A0A317EKC0_9SPHI|nr:hypothetical protein [Pedobacter yonginense]PWS27024.1 hypothetical protein DHW03_13480 [Pedobacter yonginense]